MASLQEVCELAWRQIFPNPGDETSITKEEFIATGRYEWAYQTLLASYNEKTLEGDYEVPSYLLTEVDKEIVNNEMDISDLKYFKSLPKDIWLVKIGDGCTCKYVKSTANLSQLLCDDDSLPDTTKTYYISGKKIKFPQGAHSKHLLLTYANMGEGISGNTDIDDAIGAIIRTRLNEIYLGKLPPADVTNNSNPNG